jgi:hypothetical protein
MAYYQVCIVAYNSRLLTPGEHLLLQCNSGAPSSCIPTHVPLQLATALSCPNAMTADGTAMLCRTTLGACCRDGAVVVTC